MDKERKELHEKLSKFHTLMLTTVSAEGNLLITPMTVLKYEDPGVFWFAAGLSSKKIENITENESDVFITAQDDGSLYAAARGAATLHGDSATRNEHWSEPLRVWFPKGKDDSDLVFVRVRVIEGEYWDTSGLNKARYLFKAVKAYVAGTRPEIEDTAQHARVP